MSRRSRTTGRTGADARGCTPGHPTRPRAAARTLGLAAAASLAPLLLAGCSADPAPVATATPTGITVTGTPIDASCDELVPSSALTGLWSGYTPDADYEPAGVQAEIAGYDGLACGWSDAATGATFEIAVAQLDTDVIEALKNETYRTSKAVPSYGTPPAVEGYFTTDGGQGVAAVFVDDFWIEATGTAFVEPGDPAPLIASTIGALTD